MKNKKSSLEDGVKRAKRDKEKMELPQVHEVILRVCSGIPNIHDIFERCPTNNFYHEFAQFLVNKHSINSLSIV